MNKKKTFSGYLGDCSDAQLETLDKFRAKAKALGCANPPYDDAYLLRFLRARKFDLEKSLEMFTKYINWRAEKKVDDIYHMDFSDVHNAKQYYPHLWFRTDKLGRPIFIERLGKLKFDKLTEEVAIERLELHFIQDYERLLNDMFPACSKVKGEPVTNTCYIMDLKGVSAKMFSNKVWDLLKVASKIGQDYYPEILGHMFIVNTPMFFYGMWNIIKVFVDEKTRGKIHILGSNYKKDLLKYIDENDLPDFLGGKVTVEEYGEHFNHEQGPWVKKQSMLKIQPVLQELPVLSNIQSEETASAEKIEQANFKTPKKLPPNSAEVRTPHTPYDRESHDIGQESPLKQFVRDFPQRGLTLNYASCNTIGEL